MDNHWTCNTDIQFYTDASDQAVAGYFNGEWFCVPLTDTEKKMSINWREMLAVVIAVATWGAQLRGKQMLINCDNMAVCYILKKGTSKNEHIMSHKTTQYPRSCWIIGENTFIYTGVV